MTDEALNAAKAPRRKYLEMPDPPQGYFWRIEKEDGEFSVSLRSSENSGRAVKKSPIWVGDPYAVEVNVFQTAVGILNSIKTEEMLEYYVGDYPERTLSGSTKWAEGARSA